MVPMIELGPLFPEHLSEIFMGIAFMAIIYLVLKAKVVPAFEKMHAERREAIEGGMERAEKAQADAQAALEKYTAQLTELRTEAAKIREEAKNSGATVMAEMREQANAEAARIVAGARSQIEAERGQVIEQMRNEIGGLATTLAGRIVGESLDDDERARRTVDRFIADLESDNANVTAGSGSTAS